MIRVCNTPQYNWRFNTETGFFMRWGKTLEDDPQFSPYGPEILDIEVSTICHGPGKPCPWCYKSNTAQGRNMSLETFKVVLDKIPKNLTQIAFGIGDIDSNPDLFDMFAWSRSKGVIPNVTINGWRMTDILYNKLARLCGAVAVSHYSDEECLNAVWELTSRGMDQVNIHKLLAKETLDECYKLIDLASKDGDKRLDKLNAIVFLLLKPKGKRNKFTCVDNLEDYEKLFKYAQKRGVQFGMDSCSGPNLLKATEGQNLFNPDSVEPCESTLFSLYINVDGEVFPCSFAEGQPDWERGLSMLDNRDFLQDIWHGSKLDIWRQGLLSSTMTNSKCQSCVFKDGCRSCPEFDITICRRC